MRSRFGVQLRLLAGTALLASLAATATVLATTYTNGGITLTVPSYSVTAPLLHCEPLDDPTADDITISGIPAGSTVMLNFILSSGVAGDPLVNVSQTLTNQSGSVDVTIPYPEDTTQWPYQDGTIRAINVSVAVAVTPQGGTTTKVGAKPWRVVCKPTLPDDPPPTGSAGCTPGYWRHTGEPWRHTDHHLDSWLPTGFAPGDSFDAVFLVPSNFTQKDLGYVVQARGGGEAAMGRHAVAALLNAAHPDVSYPMTVEQVRAAVVAAYNSGNFELAHHLFEGYNQIGCSIN